MGSCSQRRQLRPKAVCSKLEPSIRVLRWLIRTPCLLTTSSCFHKLENRKTPPWYNLSLKQVSFPTYRDCPPLVMLARAKEAPMTMNPPSPAEPSPEMLDYLK